MRAQHLTERGNILFLILLAVVLFAALSYAVTSSTQGGGKNASEETVKSAVAALTQYATLMENTITRLKLTNDCADEQFSFINTSVSGYPESQSPTNPKRCHIFNPEGGGMSWLVPDPQWLDSTKSSSPDYGQFLFTSRACIAYMGTGDASCHTTGLPTMELIMYLPYITEAICTEIQKQNGRSTIGQDNDGMTASNKFSGNYTAGIILQGANPVHVRSGCVRGVGGGSTSFIPYTSGYVYYHVMIIK